ncbi:hypothetical protein CI238_13175, partial [Colletotrichum incanum]
LLMERYLSRNLPPVQITSANCLERRSYLPCCVRVRLALVDQPAFADVELPDRFLDFVDNLSDDCFQVAVLAVPDPDRHHAESPPFALHSYRSSCYTIVSFMPISTRNSWTTNRPTMMATDCNIILYGWESKTNDGHCRPEANLLQLAQPRLTRGSSRHLLC